MKRFEKKNMKRIASITLVQSVGNWGC